MQLAFMITQLRDVRPARQSAKMTMKHQQKPIALVVVEMVNIAVAVAKAERDSGFAGQVFH